MKTGKTTYLVLAAFFLIFNAVSVSAQDTETDYNQVDSSLQQTEQEMQGETQFEDVRNSADDAFDDLESEMKEYESEQVTSDNPTETETVESTVAESDSSETDQEYQGYQPLFGEEDTQEPEAVATEEVALNPGKMTISHSHRMKLVDADFAEIVYSRMMRRPSAALQNPGNLGITSQTLWSLTLGASPFPTMNFNIQNSALTLARYNTFFNDGRVLTNEELKEFVNFFDGGLSIDTEISLPSLLSVKFPFLGFGTLFMNMGVYVSPKTTLSESLVTLPFNGLHFDETVNADDLSLEAFAYVKSTVGFGTHYEIGNLGDLRAGASVNLYTGSYGTLETDYLSLTSTQDEVYIQGNVIATYLDPTNTDLGNIPQVKPGFDFGVGFKTNLNQFIPIPIPSVFTNDLDVEWSLLDVGASLSSGNMIQKNYSIDGLVDDLSAFEKSQDIDSLLNIQDVTLDSNFVKSENLSTKMRVMFTYQPIDRVMLKYGFTSYLSEGLGYENQARIHLSATFFPVKWLMLTLGMDTINSENQLSTGFGLQGKHYEFAVYTRYTGGLGDNTRGVGVSLVNNIYF